MYKSRLQELCQQRLWPAPDYTVSREGPAHDSRFQASVTVNGVNFHAPDVSKSSKEAQSKAAQVAFDHFAASPPSKPSHQVPESQISYKAQLQIYAQKNKVALPKYDAVCQGYSHAPTFKANVTIDGQTFYSQQLFSTLKEAESDAAKLALSSLSLGENQSTQYDLSFYKNLLQELATKQGMLLPKYTTVDNGAHGARHMPIFSSTVEMGGESFVGDIAKTKKQAEMNAAKVAWFKLKDRLGANSERAILSSSGCSVLESTKLASSGSKPKDIRNLELPESPISPSHVKLSHKEENPSKKLVDEILLKDRPGTVVKTTRFPDDQCLHLPKETMDNANVHTEKMAAYNKLDVEITMNKEVTVEDSVNVEDSISCDGTSSPSPASDCSNHPVADVFLESPVGKACSSLLSNRVRVYPCKPDVVLPKGAISLPFSDDKWVAVSLDFSKREGIHDEVGITAENDSINVDVSLHRMDTELIGHSVSEDETSSSMESACNDLGIVDVNSAVPMGRGSSSLQHNRVRVQPNKPNMVLPEGAFRLHFSDDKWVAFSMDF